MQFENNRLTPLRPAKTQVNFAVYDIESLNWNEFLLGGFYDGENYACFTSIEGLCKHILKRKYSGWYIYAHFGGGFDHRFILDYLYKHRQDLQVTIIENSGNILSLRVVSADGLRRWTFVDSYQVIKGKLGELTTIFDVEHKKLDIDIETIEDNTETRKYLEHDCKGLYEVIEKFYGLEILKGMRHKITTSGLAMGIFRLRYLKKTILYKMDDKKEEFVRRGYYGGRVEVFKMQAKNVREYDVNSMYVSAMLNPLPCGSKGIWARGYNFEENTRAFLEVEVYCPNIHIPLLPYRTPEGKLIFPTGYFSGVYFSEEIKEALSLGYKIKIKRALIFPCESYLAEYAQDTWDIRQANPGKNGLNITAKLLGNGLYGKFAQKRERTMLMQVPFEKGCQEGYIYAFPEFNLWKVPTMSNSPAILPYISAAITSYARLTLHRFLRIHPEKVVYCDTDSVFIEDYELKNGNELGDLKYENHYKTFAAIQPKFYLAEELNSDKVKIRSKGFILDYIDWTYDDFIKALHTGNYEKFYQETDSKLTKLNEAIRVKNFLALTSRKKGVKTSYDKRLVNRQTWDTKPLYINKEGEISCNNYTL